MERELENMIFQYSQIDKKIEELELVLNNVEERDNSIYRIYFEASPISSDKRKAGSSKDMLSGSQARPTTFDGRKTTNQKVKNAKTL